MLQTSAIAIASIQVCMQLSCCCRHHGKSCQWWLYITEALTFLTRLQYSLTFARPAGEDI